MKKNIIFILMMISSNLWAKSNSDSIRISNKTGLLNFYNLPIDCDACGCSAGNGSSGFETLLQSQFIGIKYFTQHYKAKENAFVNTADFDQYFNTLMLWARIPITEKFQVYGSLPYHFHHRETNFGNQKINGIGDASVMGIYQILNKQTGKMNYHQISVGTGVKIPLGKFSEETVSGTNPSFQLGTGGWDFLTAVNYRFQFAESVVMLGADYTVKGKNDKKYKFGNQFNYSALYNYYFVQKNDFILSGKTGIQGEIYNQNKQFGENLPKTSGDALYGKIGFEAAYKKWNLGTELMLPAVSNLAHGDIEAKSRLSVFVNFGL